MRFTRWCNGSSRGLTQSPSTFSAAARAGLHGPDSDFDLMVVTRPEDGEAGYDYARAYAPLAGRGIACDVLPVPAPDFLEDKDDPTSLCFEAAHRGRKLYERG